MKKQTAVEWLAGQFDSIVELYPSQYSKISNAIDQAKAMEKEQIEDAFYHGVDVDSWNVENPYKEAEQYYQKIYGK